MSVKVMIVEDESIVAMELSSYVVELGYVVIGRVTNAVDGFRMMKREEPDIVLMDVRLKGDEDGITLAERIQAYRKTAIVYLTAFADDESLERAIATDPAAYLTKPFNRKELSASLKIASNRYKNISKKILSKAVQIDDEFSFDLRKQELFCCGESVHLTRKELELLVILLEAKQQIVDKYTIENYIWPDKDANENTRRGLVSRLRAKLKYKFIETIPGQGYKMAY